MVRLKSFDGLFADAKYLAELAGKGEEDQGSRRDHQDPAARRTAWRTPGLDTKKPFLFYAVVTPDAVSSYAALMLPVADEKAFVSFLKDTLGSFGINISKGAMASTPFQFQMRPSKRISRSPMVTLTSPRKTNRRSRPATAYAPAKLHRRRQRPGFGQRPHRPGAGHAQANGLAATRRACRRRQRPESPGETPAQSKLRRPRSISSSIRSRTSSATAVNLEVKAHRRSQQGRPELRREFDRQTGQFAGEGHFLVGRAASLICCDAFRRRWTSA